MHIAARQGIVEEGYRRRDFLPRGSHTGRRRTERDREGDRRSERYGLADSTSLRKLLTKQCDWTGYEKLNSHTKRETRMGAIF